MAAGPRTTAPPRRMTQPTRKRRPSPPRRLRPAAEAELPTLPAEVRADLDAYAAGINAFVDSHRDALPLEYTFVGGVPDPWTAADTITFGKLMAWYLGSSNLSDELLRGDL